MRFCRWFFALLFLLIPALCSDVACAAEGLYDQLTSDYLAGKWDDLSSRLTSDAKSITALPAAQKTDVEYIRRTIAESRPDWWKLCKAGNLVHFHPAVWGRSFNATFDPGAKVNLTINYLNGSPSVTVKWPSADMDNPKVEGELDFNKGEHVDLDLWTTLGTAQSWSLIPPMQQVNMSEPDRIKFSRFLAFRGNVAGIYYATPRARRLAIWNGISGWSHEYDKSQMVMCTRAIGAMYAAEILAHPKTYPTVKWPQEPPADGAESKMVWELQDWVRHHDFTFSEDKALREAIKSFATANAEKARQSGAVTFIDGLRMSLDRDADQPLSGQRDAWIKAQYAKVPDHP